MEQIASAILNVIVLVAQYFIYRYLKVNRYTADASNVETIAAIADNMNKLSRSVSIMAAAAGMVEESAAPAGNGPHRASTTPPLSEKDEAALRAANKAAMFRDLARRRF